MKGLKKFLWFLYKCLAFYTLIVCVLIFFIPSSGWVAGFIMMSFPVTMVIHLISVPIWFIIERKKVLLPLAMLILGCLFLNRTYAFNKYSEDQAGDVRLSFSVMGYNVRSFMRDSDQRNSEVKEDIGLMKKWVSDSGADVLCFAEHYEDVTALFSVDKTLARAGYRYSTYYNQERKRNANSYSGLAVFSKYPIIAAKDTVFEATNGMIQVDIKIRKDTVRVIALHLYSMTLRLSTLVHQKEMDGIKKEGRSTLSRMKTGFLQRSKEMEALESWIRQSPYPVIVCGDFNEVPYGYVYGRMRNLLTNAFEKKGNGFGFTFNHLPYFIRIDHQFYNERKLKLIDFTTFNNIKYSDHYPVMGTYSFGENRNKRGGAR